MAAPTFVQYVQTGDFLSSTGAKATASFNATAGNQIVAFCIAENTEFTIGTPPGGTLSVSWSLKQTFVNASYSPVSVWAATIGSTQNGVNVSFASTSGYGPYNVGGIFEFTGGGVGVSNIKNASTGNPSLTLTAVSTNSAVIMVDSDWNAATATAAYTGSFTPKFTYGDAAHYGAHGGYYADLGAAGDKTVGMTAPTGQAWTLIAIEILSAGGATPVTKTHSTDSFLKKTSTKTHTTDNLLLKTQSKNHTTDSYLVIRNTKTHSTDALLLKQQTVNHTTDSLFLKSQTLSHTTDSFLAILGVNSVNHSTDSLLLKAQIKTHTTDGLILKVQSITHTADSYLVNVVTQNHTTDSVLLKQTTVLHSTDSLLDAPGQWTKLTPGSASWTEISNNSDTWVAISPDSATWVKQSSPNNVWKTLSANTTNTWS